MLTVEATHSPAYHNTNVTTSIFLPNALCFHRFHL